MFIAGVSLLLFVQCVLHHRLHIIPRHYFLIDCTIHLQVCDARSLIDILDFLGFDRRIDRIVDWIVDGIPFQILKI